MPPGCHYLKFLLVLIGECGLFYRNFVLPVFVSCRLTGSISVTLCTVKIGYWWYRKNQNYLRELCQFVGLLCTSFCHHIRYIKWNILLGKMHLVQLQYLSSIMPHWNVGSKWVHVIMKVDCSKSADTCIGMLQVPGWRKFADGHNGGLGVGRRQCHSRISRCKRPTTALSQLPVWPRVQHKITVLKLSVSSGRYLFDWTVTFEKSHALKQSGMACICWQWSSIRPWIFEPEFRIGICQFNGHLRRGNLAAREFSAKWFQPHAKL